MLWGCTLVAKGEEKRVFVFFFFGLLTRNNYFISFWGFKD
jgi:hypothetical protein